MPFWLYALKPGHYIEGSKCACCVLSVLLVPLGWDFAWFAGVCPVLCSQRGEYINGECQCNPGWKGKECSLRHDECEVPDCNGHGHCVNGKCACVRGYMGKFCEEGKCLPHEI